MATRGRSDAALETTGKGQMGTDGTATMIPAGPTQTATRENAIAKSGTRSRAMFTCRVGTSASSFTIETASTPYAAPNRARSRPSVHSEWSPVVICATTTAAPPIHARATCDTCANKG